ncbi:hypothetical protein ACJIZ3_008581 [Penstemon smallii]|uniref:Uncharacterized protein n=1 Tax=Penstemon smallii TaxID=265156 RepID=A0ABD3TBE0_9LAMI
MTNLITKVLLVLGIHNEQCIQHPRLLYFSKLPVHNNRVSCRVPKHESIKERTEKLQERKTEEHGD